MIETERVLFEDRLGSHRVRIWLEPSAGDIRLLSHEIGAGLERFFGRDEIETFFKVDAVHVPKLIAAMRAERTDEDPPLDAIELLAARYRGDSTASSSLRTRLTSHGIPYRSTIGPMPCHTRTRWKSPPPSRTCASCARSAAGRIGPRACRRRRTGNAWICGDCYEARNFEALDVS